MTTTAAGSDLDLIQAEVHEFAAQVVRPASIALDKLADPEAVIEKESLLWDVIRESYRLGFHTRGFPEALGGTSLGPEASWAFTEEMAWASVDLAIATGVGGMPFQWAAQSGNQELIDRFVVPFLQDKSAEFVGCWAITEPNHGSDAVLATGDTFTNPDVTYDVRAVADGDEWVISGQKSGWVSNGTIATHALLFLTIEPEQGMAGGGVAFVPLDVAGVSKGPPTNKLGQRALNQGEIFFDQVRIPRHYMLVEPPGYRDAIRTVLTGANAGMSVLFAGLTRAAYEEGMQYAQERVQGGRRICEHQLVQRRLFDMFMKVQATQEMSKLALRLAATPQPTLHNSIAAKVFCTQASFEVASDAVQLHGGFGMTKDCFAEKLFRDARASLVEDGANDVLALLGAGMLLNQDEQSGREVKRES